MEDELHHILARAEDAQHSGRYDEAERLCREALAALPSPPEKGLVPFHVTALLRLANVIRLRGGYDDALATANEALVLATAYHHRAGEANARNLIGLIYQDTSDYRRALEAMFQALAVHEELGNAAIVAKITGNIGGVYDDLSDYPRALEHYLKALAVHERTDNAVSAGLVMGNIGILYTRVSDYPRTLEYMFKALALHESNGMKAEAATVTGNIGSVYMTLSDYPRALEYMTKALAAHEELGMKAEAATVNGNIGSVHKALGDYPRALEYMTKALAAHVELGMKTEAARVRGNIGIVHWFLADYSQALTYMNESLAEHQQLGNAASVAGITGNIGSVYATEHFAGYDPAKAEEYLLRAIELCRELGAKHFLVENEKALADVYKSTGRKAEAFDHFEKFYELEKEIHGEETRKQAERLDFERQAAERDKQLAVERAEAAATKKLLHNTLPPEIADRLLAGEKIADAHTNVSVLFADIVDFTRLSERITPAELVEGLDSIFSQFDELAGKHGLEKIKTIGDCYMVIAGAPVPRADHAAAVALMALEMMEICSGFRAISTGEPIRLRIGLHTGEVVAGVIGRKKFAYDLWGDAVNTAARMESHGEAGRIHCSEEFVQALIPAFFQWEKEIREHSLPLGDGKVRVIERGDVEIKGKGTMKTCFLEKPFLP